MLISLTYVHFSFRKESRLKIIQVDGLQAETWTRDSQIQSTCVNHSTTTFGSTVRQKVKVGSKQFCVTLHNNMTWQTTADNSRHKATNTFQKTQRHCEVHRLLFTDTCLLRYPKRLRAEHFYLTNTYWTVGLLRQWSPNSFDDASPYQ
jgi:hypothetical protein